MTLRLRMILAALLPVSLVAVLLSVLFLQAHLRDLDTAQETEVRILARQAAISAEFGLFAGNDALLRAVVDGILRADADVTGVSIVDADGNVRAVSGEVRRGEWPAREQGEVLLSGARGLSISVPVRPRRLDVDDFYAVSDARLMPQGAAIGHVVLETSRQRLQDERNRLILLGMVVTALGIAFGGLLALRIARSITRPVLAATEVVDRIGQGDLAARVPAGMAGTLGRLATGINAMAERVAINRDEMRREILAATDEIASQRDAAQRATAAKSRFLAAASHDLRQPLHALGLFVSRLAGMPAGPDVKGLVRHVETSVTTLQEMLDALLDLSRMEAESYRAAIQEFDLTAMLEHMVRDMTPLARQRELVLRSRLFPCWVRSDRRLVERMVLNLLSNALRYTDRGGILLAMRHVGGKVRIQVWDTGRGIPAAMQGEIFEEFVQVGNDERDRQKGLGLGLAICQRIARVLETSIGLRSNLGSGSVFWFDLPAAMNPERLVATGPQAVTPFAGGILVVDDDPMVRDGTASFIEGWGGEARPAQDAEQALDLVRGDPGWCRFAICDVRLPGDLDGIALAEALRRFDPAIRILLISADVTPALQAQAREAGFPLLRKPVAPARLRATLLSLQGTGASDTFTLTG